MILPLGGLLLGALMGGLRARARGGVLLDLLQWAAVGAILGGLLGLFLLIGGVARGGVTQGPGRLERGRRGPISPLMIRLLVLPIILAVIGAIVSARLAMRRTARELDARSVELVDPSLRPVLDRLAGALDLPRIRLHLYDVGMVNGLAAPDGRVFLTRGFLDRLRAGTVTPEELGGVVAHELGHVALGHARRRMIDFGGQNAVRVGLAFLLGRLLGGVGVWVAQGLVALLAAGLSRRDEFEADAYASALLIKAGLGVAPQVSLLRKLGAEAAAKGAAAPAWLLTHPRTESRVAAIEGNAARWLKPPAARP